MNPLTCRCCNQQYTGVFCENTKCPLHDSGPTKITLDAVAEAARDVFNRMRKEK